MTTQTSASDAFTIPKARIRQAGIVAGIIVAVVLVVIGIVALVRSLSSSDSLSSAINPHEFQAVLLTNGQSFFGKLSHRGGDFYDLRDVYYLATTGSGRSARQTLVKLGNEIQGPEDLIVINRSQIVYVENLKPSGQVTRRILHPSGP